MDGYKHKDTPWRDPYTLSVKYVYEGKSTPQIGSELGCSANTVGRWLDNLGIVRRYQDKEWMHRKYVVEDLTGPEIATKLGRHTGVVYDWLRKHDVKIPKACDRPANFRHSTRNAYEYWECGKTGDIMYVHRLLAVAEYGIEAVKGMDVHHEIEIPWLNTPDNVKLMGPSEHRSHHSLKRGAIPPWHKKRLDEQEA